MRTLCSLIQRSAKRVLAWAPIICGSLSVFFTSLPASGETALLQLQKSSTVAGPWQPMPANLLPVTPEGNLADTTAGTAFYRLQISTSDVLGGPITLPLQSVSAQTLQLAQHMLNSSPGGGSAWENAALAPYVYPVYNPVINGGTNPAYLEFKVIAGPPPTNTFPGTPLESSADRGFILVSLTTQDVPIPEMAQDGPTRIEQLRKAAQSSSVRAVRASIWTILPWPAGTSCQAVESC